MGKINCNNNFCNLVMIMEAGDEDASKFITNNIQQLDSDKKEESKIKIRHLIYSLYNGLYELNKELDYFIHGDAKSNNFIIKNNKIMIIDLGFSKFKLHDLVFKSNVSKGVVFTKDKFNNVNQDILHLISSFYNTIYNLKNTMRYIKLLNNTFTYNNDSNHIIYKMFNIGNILYLKRKIKKIQYMYKYLYNNNYKNIFKSDDYNMNPEQMKKDLNISISDEDIYETYKYKYLKYKQKYLELELKI